MKSDVIIDPEFQMMIPPLSGDELNQLEDNLVEAGGARDPLVVWKTEGKRILLDGHNRHAICKRLGLHFSTEEISLPDREAAKDWIDRNQLGRRNLSKEWTALLLGRRYNRTRMNHGGDRKSSDHFDHLIGQTSEALAKEHGVGDATIRRHGQFAEAVEKLGIEKQIVSGQLDLPKSTIVEVTKDLPENPTQDQINEAIEEAKKKDSRPKKINPERESLACHLL